jgi:hypothetical protein
MTSPVPVRVIHSADSINLHSLPHTATEPLLFRGLVTSHWRALTDWSLSRVTTTFAANSAVVEAQFSMHTTSLASATLPPRGEVDRIRRHCTLTEFVRTFVQGAGDGELTRQSHWGYVSYCYLRELLEDECPSALIDWSRFNAELTSLDTTLWVGTAGSFTPCHYDSYGCNWVAQIDGRKRWRVWPPDAPMAPTRVPFEESTVWSALPLAQHTGGFEAVLEPGDVLFVPHHWWHFVESLTDSVAANLWVPHSADTLDNEIEAVVRLLAELLVGERPPAEQQRLVNPGEMLGFREENLNLVASVLDFRYSVLIEDWFRIEYLLTALTSESVLSAAAALDSTINTAQLTQTLTDICNDTAVHGDDDDDAVIPIEQLLHVMTHRTVVTVLVRELKHQAASRADAEYPLPVGTDGQSMPGML